MQKIRKNNKNEGMILEILYNKFYDFIEIGSNQLHTAHFLF